MAIVSSIGSACRNEGDEVSELVASEEDRRHAVLRWPVWPSGVARRTRSPRCAEPQKVSDPWESFRYFVGTWEGAGKGKPGNGKGEQRYEFVLGGRFLHIRNVAVYEPQPANPKGERHEDWGLISFDKRRGTFVWRQFHAEGFVNQYVLEKRQDPKTFVFVTESIENLPPGWRARETLKIVSEDEFAQVFELAEPGKEFEVYAEGRLHRKK
jgi:hypothetical protein